MTKSNNSYSVEVRSEMTGNSVIKFETDDVQSARKVAYNKIAKFLNVDRAVASLSYYVNIEPAK